MKRKKTGGRTQGTPNKVTAETRDLIKAILEAELPNLSTYISEIEKPEVKAKIIIELLPYTTPKYSNVTMETNEDVSKGVNLPDWFNEPITGITVL